MLGGALPLAALWAIPVVAVAALLPMSWAEEGKTLKPGGGPVSHVGERTLSYRQTIDVTVAYPDALLLASPRAGTVTEVSVRPGSRPANGEPLVSIDGRVLFALTGETPLYRELRRGSVGPDVRAMADFLAARGLLDPSHTNNEFGVNIERGVRAFQRSAGEAPDGVFRPASTVFVPYVQGSVAELKTHVGAQVDLGTPLLTVRTRPTSISFAVGGSEIASPRPLRALSIPSWSDHRPAAHRDTFREQFDAIVDALTAAVTEGAASASKGDSVSVTYVGQLCRLRLRPSSVSCRVRRSCRLQTEATAY